MDLNKNGLHRFISLPKLTYFATRRKMKYEVETAFILVY